MKYTIIDAFLQKCGGTFPNSWWFNRYVFEDEFGNEYGWISRFKDAECAKGYYTVFYKTINTNRSPLGHPISVKMEIPFDTDNPEKSIERIKKLQILK